MYNEETLISTTIEHLLKIETRCCFNVIVIDDGSSDNSCEVVKSLSKFNPKISIFTQRNSGKAAALNLGLSHCRSEIIICLDADTLVKSNVLNELLKHFTSEKVAGVAGHIVVGNCHNLITNIQSYEYLTSQNIERQLFQTINSIITIPGALGAFRKSVLEKVGGFKNDTLIEDGDLTMEILHQNFTIKNSATAMGFTEAPSSLATYLKQRTRWKIGLLQVLIKHGRLFVKHSNKWINRLIIPYSWLNEVIFPIATPLMECFILIRICFKADNFLTILCYLIFILLDTIFGHIVLRRIHERKNIFVLILYRLLIRQVGFLVYVQMLFSYAQGNLKSWNKVVRKGNAKVG